MGMTCYTRPSPHAIHMRFWGKPNLSLKSKKKTFRLVSHIVFFGITLQFLWQFFIRLFEPMPGVDSKEMEMIKKGLL